MDQIYYEKSGYVFIIRFLASFLVVIFIVGCDKHITKDERLNANKENSFTNRPKNLGKNIFINGEVISEEYKIIEDIDNRLDIFVVKKGNRFGLINNKKKIILPIEYDTIERPHLENYFYITKNSLTGVVTKVGNLNIPIYYESIEYDWKNNVNEEEDGFIVQKNKKLGSIDFYNNVIIPIEYDGVSNWVEYGPSAHYIKKNGLYGLVDYNTGALKIPPIYDGLVASCRFVWVKKNGKYGVLTYRNKVVFPCVYTKIFIDLDCYGFEEVRVGRVLVEKNNIWYEYYKNGLLKKSNVPKDEIDKRFLTDRADSTEFSYHLKDCMVFPH